MEPTRAVVIALLRSIPGQPRKALYQHSFPLVETWGYLPDRDSPIIPFETQDTQKLHSEGVLEFIRDERGVRCAVLAEGAVSHVPSPPLASNGASMSSEALRAELEVRNQQIRRLLVGDGPTFSDLEVNGKVGDGTPYGFEDLLDLPADAPTPPLVFIHIPRTAGTTVNKILMRNYKYRADSHGPNFFPPYFPDQFLSLVQRPHSPDDRIRPAFFTGHIDLTNKIFRYMPVRYVALTVLRAPIDRIISHYRFNSTQPSIFQDAIRKQGLDVVSYVKHFGAAIPQQYELFAPPSVGSAEKRATQALRNLEELVSLFGLQERFEEFTNMLAGALGLPDVSHKALNKLPSGAADVTQEQIEEIRPLLKNDIDFYEGVAKLYNHRRKLMAMHGLATPHPWT